MKKIVLLQLSLLNFKGLKSFSIDFQDNTDILGANGTGKTTIADAFTWLLFGKDTTDRKDFEIKTLDQTGKAIPMIDHEVSASLLVDNEPLTLRRVLKENWVKKRGNEDREFAGNVTELYWNDVPVTVTEFNKKVNDLCEESIFKIITNPEAFNSNKSGTFGDSKKPMWENRRNLLIDIFGEVSNEDVAKGNSAFEKLLSKLTQGKTLEDYKNQILASIKKAKEDLKNIPARIDEVFRSKPEAQDFEALEKELSDKQTSLTKIDTEIADINKAYESKLEASRKDKLSINNLKSKIEIIEQNAGIEAHNQTKSDNSILESLSKEFETKKSELESFENGLKTLETKKVGIENEINSITSKMDQKRNEWNSENEKEISFNDNDFHCPTCKREFESGDVEAKKAEAIKNFNSDKQKKLAEISSQGKNLSAQKESLKTELESLKTRIETTKTSIETAKVKIQELQGKIETEKSKVTKEVSKEEIEKIYKSILDSDNTYQEHLLELQHLESTLLEDPTIDNSELIEKRKALVYEIDTLKTKLQSKAQIEAAEKRILELQDEERNLSQQIADVEKEQFVIENFIKAKVDSLERIVNSKFKYVNFKMFDEQINGGLKETCEATVNGVPFSDVNTASKINAGLDIINVLSEFYGISAPIFIDNAESVHTLIDTESQMIRLVVSESSKALEVKNPIKKEMVA